MLADMGCSWSSKTPVQALRAADGKGAEVGADSAKIMKYWGLSRQVTWKLM